MKMREMRQAKLSSVNLKEDDLDKFISSTTLHMSYCYWRGNPVGPAVKCIAMIIIEIKDEILLCESESRM